VLLLVNDILNILLYRPSHLSRDVGGKLRDLFSLSGCQQGQEGAREIHSTHGETSRRKKETA
jgi:hypothetical protein